MDASVFYEDSNVKLIHGDCRTTPLAMIGDFDAVITDPPYGENMGYEGDDPVQAEELLNCALSTISDRLRRGSHVAIFWTMRNLDQCIDAVRAHGLTYRRTLSMYLPRGSARPYLGWLPRTQPIVIAQKYLPKQPTLFHTDMATHINEAINKSGFTRNKIAEILGCDSRLVMKWSRVGDPAWCLPTPRFYPKLKKLLNLSSEFDILIDRQPVNKENRDYEYKHDCYVVDEDRTSSYGHPSEKPVSVLRHLINCMTLPGQTVLDLFSGSGSTLEAAVLEGRKAIGIELEKQYCTMAVNRVRSASGHCIISDKKTSDMFQDLFGDNP